MVEKMPDFKDFLPLPPWRGPPLPRGIWKANNPVPRPVSKRLDKFHIELDAFWVRDFKTVQRLLERLDDATLNKLAGWKITVTPGPTFIAPPPHKPIHMTGLTRTYPWKSVYPAGNVLTILGSEPTEGIVYHEIAHALGMEEEEAREFEKKMTQRLAS